MKYLLISLALLGYRPMPDTTKQDVVVFKNMTLIDGSGGAPAEQTDMRTEAGKITAIGKGLTSEHAQVVDLTGKTVMPELISTHMHIGTLRGTQTNPENYTRDNILAQLKKYESYGVGNVLVMGTDRPMLFETGLRDSSTNGLLPGARLYSAGFGFGVPQNAPPGAAMDDVQRPATAAEVPALIGKVAALHPAVIKMWVDDFGGKFKKMDPQIYGALIRESHMRKIRVAAHLYYLSDARKLVANGLDIIAHSIRDSLIDDDLIQEMKRKHVVYIPTLSLDEYAYIYARMPEWINDAFFKASLEPGVYEMIISKKYQDDLKNSPDYDRNKKAFETALKNLMKIYSAGILVSMGTDSGATPVRAQGFSEHLELELMVQAGLTPLQAITVATKNASQVLNIDKQFGTLENGKSADFIVLKTNPANDIKNTRSIEGVYKKGVLVSKGPLAK